MKVEPLDETQLEDLGLNTYNHDIPLSSREVPSFDELEPQPKPLANFIIEQLAKDGEKNVLFLEHKRRSSRKVTDLKNTTYHSR
ncbi:hypothetical protein Tco_1394389 [Tanacetum coccineum]